MRGLIRLVTGGVVLSAAVAGAASAQEPPLRALKVDLEYPEPFSCISGFRELSDGRVVVSDVREKRVEIIDLRRGTVTKIARQGQGPGEWAVPQGMYALPGDTTLMWDPQNRRFLTINPNGSVGKEVVIDLGTGTAGGPPAMGGAGGGGGMAIGRAGAGGMGAMLRGPQGLDRMGRFYFQGSNIVFGDNGPTQLDSAPILRYDRKTAKVDTVAFLQLPKSTMQTSGTPASGRVMMTMTSPNPFVPQPMWAVAPDGRIAIIRAEPYQVEWISPAKVRSVGPVTRYQRLRLVEADKAPLQAPQCPVSISFGTPGGGGGAAGAGATTIATRAVVGGEGRGGAPRTDYPEYKPPFAGRYGAAAVAPNGELWIPRTREVNDAQTYDIFDARGQLASRVELPKGTRLVGFGNGTLYGYRMDADDLVYLQRFRLDGTR